MADKRETYQQDKFLEKLRAKGRKVSKASDQKRGLNFIPSGSIYLDKAMGTRGYPQAKFIQISGEPSLGKTLLSLIAEGYVTRAGFGVIRCDLENQFEQQELQEWRKSFGIDLEHVFDISGHQDAEAVLDTVVQLLKKYPDYIRLVVVDSIGALASTATLNKDLEDGHIDDNPKLVNRFCRVVNVANTNATVMLISHVGAKFGAMHATTHAKGGIGVQHWASLRLKVTGMPVLESKDDYGFYKQRKISVIVEKNKVATPGGVAKDLIFDLELGAFDTLGELITLCKMNGLIETKGSYLCLPDTDIKVQGEAGFKKYLMDNPEVAHTLFYNVTGYTLADYFNVGDCDG